VVICKLRSHPRSLPGRKPRIGAESPGKPLRCAPSLHGRAQPDEHARHIPAGREPRLVQDQRTGGVGDHLVAAHHAPGASGPCCQDSPIALFLPAKPGYGSQRCPGCRPHAATGQIIPTSRTPGPGAIRSTACASRPATVQASEAPVGAGGGRRTPAAIGTARARTPTGTPAAAPPAGDMPPATTPTAAGPPVPMPTRQLRERALRLRSIPLGRRVAGAAPQPRPRCSRRATTAAGRQVTLRPHGPRRMARHRGTDQHLAARLAKDRSAVTRLRLASRRRCTRPASSLPGTSARTAGQGRDQSQVCRIAAGSPTGHAGTAASLIRSASYRRSRALARGITTVPAPILAIPCWRSATPRQTLLRRKPGRRSATAGRPGRGQLRPGPALGLAASPAAREEHPGGTARRLAPLGRTGPARERFPQTRLARTPLARTEQAWVPPGLT